MQCNMCVKWHTLALGKMYCQLFYPMFLRRGAGVRVVDSEVLLQSVLLVHWVKCAQWRVPQGLHSCPHDPGQKPHWMQWSLLLSRGAWRLGSKSPWLPEGETARGHKGWAWMGRCCEQDAVQVLLLEREWEDSSLRELRRKRRRRGYAARVGGRRGGGVATQNERVGRGVATPQHAPPLLLPPRRRRHQGRSSARLACAPCRAGASGRSAARWQLRLRSGARAEVRGRPPPSSSAWTAGRRRRAAPTAAPGWRGDPPAWPRRPRGRLERPARPRRLPPRPAPRRAASVPVSRAWRPWTGEEGRPGGPRPLPSRVSLQGCGRGGPPPPPACPPRGSAPRRPAGLASEEARAGQATRNPSVPPRKQAPCSAVGLTPGKAGAGAAAAGGDSRVCLCVSLSESRVRERLAGSPATSVGGWSACKRGGGDLGGWRPPAPPGKGHRTRACSRSDSQSFIHSFVHCKQGRCHPSFKAG